MAGAVSCSELTITEHSSLDDLAGIWDGLLAESYDNRLFLTFDWLRVWRSSFPEGSLRLLEARDESIVSGILPLLQLDRPDGHELTLLGDPEVMDYMDGLADREQAEVVLSRLWRRALEGEGWDRVWLRHVPSNSPLIAALEDASARLGLSVSIEEDTVCPVAILCGSWDGYLEMLSKKQRHEIRRKLRRAQEGADCRWRTVETNADLERDLPIFFRLHEASAADKAEFLTDSMRAFFRAVTEWFLAKDYLRLSIFSRDGTDIAATLSFLYRGRWLLYNSGYDPAYRAYSPGIAAVALSMQQAIAEKAVAFDFLSGDEPYKYQFGATNTYTCRAEIRRT